MAQSRKRRKERQRAAAQLRAAPAAAEPATEPAADAASPAERGYSRSRAKDEAARAALQAARARRAADRRDRRRDRRRAARPGERGRRGARLGPGRATRTTAPGRSPTRSSPPACSSWSPWGMWKAKYWAVLGMQTLLALTLIGSSLALVTVEQRRRRPAARGHPRRRRHAVLVHGQGDGAHPDARAADPRPLARTGRSGYARPTVLSRIRSGLTYSNVRATAALFVALGGTPTRSRPAR